MRGKFWDIYRESRKRVVSSIFTYQRRMWVRRKNENGTKIKCVKVLITPQKRGLNVTWVFGVRHVKRIHFRQRQNIFFFLRRPRPSCQSRSCCRKWKKNPLVFGPERIKSSLFAFFSFSYHWQTLPFASTTYFGIAACAFTFIYSHAFHSIHGKQRTMMWIQPYITFLCFLVFTFLLSSNVSTTATN